MDNMHQPPGGDPQDHWPTEEFDPAGGQAAYLPGPYLVGPGVDGGQQPSGEPAGQGGHQQQLWARPAGAGGPSGPQPPLDRVPGGRRLPGGALRWGAGLALAGLLAVGGVLAATSASQSPAGPAGQAAVLNTMLNSATSSTANGVSGSAVTASAAPSAPCRNRAAKLKAAGFPSIAQTILRRCGHGLRRLRALGGLHGQFTFETKSGPRTIAFERGVIRSVSGAEVVVQAKDGTTWTWVLGSSSVIRESGKRVAASALSDGENVFAGGPVVGGTYDARLIVIRVSSPSPSSSSASGS
jgi:hypothetical protein